LWAEVTIVVLAAFCLYLIYRLVYFQKGLAMVSELLKAYIQGDLQKRLYLDRKDRLQEVALLLNSLAEQYAATTADASKKGYSLNAVLESIPDAIVLMSSDERIEVVNPSFEKFVSMRKDEIIGRRLNELVRIPEVFNALDRVKTHEMVIREEFFNDETGKYYEAIACPLRTNSAVVLILRDITDMKRTEQVRRDFVANVSHELKTPITTIKGYAETLLDGAAEEPETMKEFLQTILSYSQRMENLVNDLIQLTKIESGVLIIKKKEVRILSIFEEVCQSFRTRAEQKALRLYWEVVPESLTVEADPMRLVQILHNLVDNAIKFTEEGEVTLKAYRQDSAIYIEVKDTGIGIPKWALSRLGERFFRVDPSRSRALGGTGLGLAIVKHLVLAHGWQLIFESLQGSGTVVKMIIK